LPILSLYTEPTNLENMLLFALIPQILEYNPDATYFSHILSSGKLYSTSCTLASGWKLKEYTSYFSNQSSPCQSAFIH
jgi:hypothetical protein